MKRLRHLLPPLLTLALLTACGSRDAGTVQSPPPEEELPAAVCPVDQETETLTAATLQRDGHYYARDDVLLYLTVYGRLPENYITEEEARSLGWTDGSVEDVAPGCAIGGDLFAFPERLPMKGITYLVCDVDTAGQPTRGENRLVYADDLSYIYFTGDGGETFQLVYRPP